jgi:2-polyprenyl-3-methyl-5-hydroxy-6-metoxy-1,4-benzoquinol methylase
MRNVNDSKDELKKFYGPDYVDRFEKNQPLFRLSRLMKYVEISKDADIADFGCGNGLLLTYLHDKVRTYSGVDFSEFFIETAKRRQIMLGIENAEFFCESIESFCSRNNEKFDAGFVLDLAEHVPDEEWIRILAAIRKSLKPCGKLYLHTPNAVFFIEIMKKKNFLLHQFKEHVAVRNINENTQMLENAGFSDHNVIQMSHYNVLKYLDFFKIIPHIGKYFEARIFIVAKK